MLTPMMELITIQVTQEDLDGAEKYGLHDPILHAIGRTTGTLWHISEAGLAREITPPYRRCALSAEVLGWRCVYQETQAMAPFEFEAQLDSSLEDSSLEGLFT